jgi:hypothetical protein
MHSRPHYSEPSIDRNSESKSETCQSKTPGDEPGVLRLSFYKVIFGGSAKSLFAGPA